MTEPDEPVFDEENTELFDIDAFQIEAGKVVVSDPSFGFSQKGTDLARRRKEWHLGLQGDLSGPRHMRTARRLALGHP